MNRPHDVVIIGAGPAGIAAAIQLKRHHIEPVLLEQGEIGGLLKNANFVENYPGFPEGIGGPDLVGRFREHLHNAGVTVNYEKVKKLDYEDNVFLTTTDQRSIPSNKVVIATGTKPVKAPLPIPDEVTDRVMYDVYPIRGVRNTKIVIIGAGDAAFDYALNMSEQNDVLILNRGNRISSLPVLQERCMKTERIRYTDRTQVRQIMKKEDRLELTCIATGSQQQTRMDADYVLWAIGREPSLGFLGIELKKQFEDLIKRHKLYAVGDVRNDLDRQTAICVGDGIKAAMQISRNRMKG